jgi:hypothetical protein
MKHSFLACVVFAATSAACSEPAGGPRDRSGVPAVLPQPIYQIANVPMRVRLLLANKNEITALLGDSPAHDQISDDPIMTDRIGMFASVSSPPAEVGLDSLAEGNDYFAGLNINPPLLGCGLDMVRIVESAGYSHPELFRQSEELNIVIKPIQERTQSGIAVKRGPALGGAAQTQAPFAAIHVRLPFVAPVAKCELPTAAHLVDLLKGTFT